MGNGKNSKGVDMGNAEGMKQWYRKTGMNGWWGKERERGRGREWLCVDKRKIKGGNYQETDCPQHDKSGLV